MSGMPRSNGTSMLLSIEYIRLMLSSGAGLETLMKSLAEKGFGDVSSAASKAMRMSSSGHSLDDSIKEITRHEQDQDVRQILTLLLSDRTESIDAELEEVSQRVISRKRMSSDAMVARLESFLPIFIILMALPIESILHKVLDDTLSQLSSGMRIPGLVDEAILLSSIGGIIILSLLLRYRE